MSKLVANKLGLVAVRMLKSEAGLGVRAGEIRGVPPETAEKMIELKSAELVDVKPDKAA